MEDDSAGLEAEVFALQSKTYPTTASAAFVNARGDIAPTPIFPNRPMVRASHQLQAAHAATASGCSAGQ